MARAGAQSHVDPEAYMSETKSPGTHDPVRRRQQKHERFDIPFGYYFLLHPGSLALVPTLEWLKLPMELQGIVTARSSWAREGLNIATATIINPDYRGIVTLELANFGEIPIKLFPGLRLAQLALYRMESVDPGLDGGVDESQFDLSFEPSAGNVSKGDEPFILEGRKVPI